MSRQEGSLFALSLVPQTDYNTPLAPSSAPKNYEQISKVGYDKAKFTTSPVTNEGMSTGTAYPTKSFPSVHDVEQSFEERATFENIGRRLLALLGGYTVSTVAPGVFKHAFAPLNPLLLVDLPSYSYVEKIGEPVLDTDIIHDLLYPGFKCESGTIANPSSAENGAFLMATTQWRGSGKQLGSPVASGTGSGINFLKTAVHVEDDATRTENYLKSTSGIVGLFPSASFGGTVQVLGCDFRGFNFSHNNNFLSGQGYQGCGKFQIEGNADSGAVRGSLPIGKPSTDISFSALIAKTIAQDFNPLKRLRAQDTFSLRLDWAGALIAGAVFRSLTFKAPKLTVKDVGMSADDTLDKYDISAATLAAGNVLPFSWELVNNIPNYTTLV